MHRLSATKVKQAKPREKSYKLADGGGLCLLIRPIGKYWRYNYRFLGKQKTLALGVFPDVSLAEARKRHLKARELLSEDTDPSEVKRVQKFTKELSSENTFRCIAEEWFQVHMLDKSKKHKDRAVYMLSTDLYPVLGSRPIASIKPTEVLAALRKIEARGVDAAKAKSLTSQIFKYGISTGRCENDPSRDLASALKKKRKKHHTAITTPKEAKQLMTAIQGYDGTPVVKAALEISALTFQRPGEIRHMEWNEINWRKQQWEISGLKMKMQNDHIVPLARQSTELLVDLQMTTGNGRYVFPSARGGSRPLSDNGVRIALRTMGYDKETMTPHGFRAMARTLLDEELGFPVEWIEHQLAHAVRDANGRAYNRTSHLENRRKMIQTWADYLYGI